MGASRAADRALAFSLGDRQSLRLLEDPDALELYEVVVRNRTFLSEWLPWPPIQTLERSREFVAGSRRQLAANQGFQAAIVDSGRIVGVIGFHRLDWENRSTSIGYWLAEDAQGRGLVTRAVRALLDHAFGVWQLNRVEIRAGVGNLRSRAVAERLGFREEGVLREAELVGDRWIDHVVYAMLAGDWSVRAVASGGTEPQR
jgi:ribosomal-protein-serine acetyltransferase